MLGRASDGAGSAGVANPRARGDYGINTDPRGRRRGGFERAAFAAASPSPSWGRCGEADGWGSGVASACVPGRHRSCATRGPGRVGVVEVLGEKARALSFPVREWLGVAETDWGAPKALRRSRDGAGARSKQVRRSVGALISVYGGPRLRRRPFRPAASPSRPPFPSGKEKGPRDLRRENGGSSD